MAVFQAAADESDGPKQRGLFLFGGFVAPVTYWVNSVTPAWEERVLNVSPSIPYLHMTEIRSRKWRSTVGLTEIQAEERVDEAVGIISSMEDLRLVRTNMDGGHFRDKFKTTRLKRPGRQHGAYLFEPDFIGFLGFAYGALDYVAKNFPGAEKVDFVVERKGRVTHNLRYFHERLAEGLRHDGRADLVPLIGELIPGGKERVPLQAADVAMWHLRRYESNEFDHRDLGRLQRMFHGRLLTVSGLTKEQIDGIDMRSKVRSAGGDGA